MTFHGRSDRKAIYWRRGQITDDGSDVLFPDGRKLSDLIRALRLAVSEGHQPEVTVAIRIPERNVSSPDAPDR